VCLFGLDINHRDQTCIAEGTEYFCAIAGDALPLDVIFHCFRDRPQILFFFLTLQQEKDIGDLELLLHANEPLSKVI